MLLMLAEGLSELSCSIIQSNTDGCFAIVPKNKLSGKPDLIYKNITTKIPTIKQYTEKYISFPSLTIFLNHLVTRNVTIVATRTART